MEKGTVHIKPECILLAVVGKKDISGQIKIVK